MRRVRFRDLIRFARSFMTITSVFVLSGAPALGLDFVSEFLVYQEDYQGEFVFPTIPEVNEIGAAGLGLEPGAHAPVLTGTSAHVALGPSTPGPSGTTFIGGTTFGPGGIGLRGHFENQSSSGGTTLVSVSGVFDTPTTFDTSIFAWVVVSKEVGGVPIVGHLMIWESDGEGQSDATEMSFALPPDVATALSAGASFTLDLLVDRDLGIATVTLDVPGLATQIVGPMALGFVTPAHPFSGGSQFAVSGCCLPTFEVDFTGFEIYRVPTPVVVDTLLDVTDALPGDGVCESAGGFCSLRAAIQESNASVGPAEIIVPAGTYLLTRTGAEEDAAGTGDLDILDDLILRGVGRNLTILDGNAIDRVFDVPFTASEPFVQLEDLTITNGAAVTSGGFRGGAINNHGRLTLNRCIVSNSDANLAGGIMNLGELVVDDCVVTGNDAINLGFTTHVAGGIASASSFASAPSAVATIRNSAIVGNTGFVIGGIELGNAANALIENSTLSGNSGRQLSIFNVDASLRHVTIVANSGNALSAGSSTGTRALVIANSAISGAPACSVNSVVRTNSGNNASNDATCGFVGAGDVEGVSLGLAPLSPVADSQAHIPMSGSPLIDAASINFCLVEDQVQSTRPIDGDGNGLVDCDLGAIEVPEAGAGVLIATGGLWLSGCAAFRRRKGLERAGRGRRGVTP